MTPRRLPIHISVVLAFLHSGGRKAGTPFEMASTPVTAAPPDANAWSTTKSVTTPVPRLASAGMGSGCSPPVSDRNSPNPSNANIITMKKYVGTANIRPDSRTPRRLP